MSDDATLELDALIERAAALEDEAFTHLSATGPDRPANVERAITLLEEALRGLPVEVEPELRAQLLNNLGGAHIDCTAGERHEHIARAVACYEEARSIWTPETAPRQAAMLDNNLGMALRNLATGDRAENLRRSIFHLERALGFYSLEHDPQNYASVQHHLGNALSDLPGPDRADAMARAVACYREALKVWTAEADPQGFALVQTSLGLAYRSLTTADRRENGLRAIACFQAALRVTRPETFRFQYALAENALGVAWLYLPSEGDREECLRRAIACFEHVLQLWTLRAAPHYYAGAHNNLAIAYHNLPGEGDENILLAIDHYEYALQGFSRQTAPLEWAMAQHNLGSAHARRTEGDPAEIKRNAIAALESAASVYQLETLPLEHASTQTHLGLTWLRRGAGGVSDFERALACFQQASRVFTVDTAPADVRAVQGRIGDIHFERRNYGEALAAYEEAMRATERMFQAGLSRSSRAATVAAGMGLFQKAAFSAAQLGGAEHAFSILERGKTRVLAESLRLRPHRPDNVSDEVWSTLEEAGAHLRALVLPPSDDPLGGLLRTPDDYDQRARRAPALVASFECAIDAVRVVAPAFLAAPTTDELAKLLGGEDAALVTFCVTPQGGLALVVVDGKPVQVVELPLLTTQALEALLEQRDREGNPVDGWLDDYEIFRAEGTDRSFTIWLATFNDVMAGLAKRVIEPLVGALPKGIQRLVLLPVGGLFLLPLHAVPLAPGWNERLCDRFEVSYAPSAVVLRTCLAREPRASERTLFAVVSPGADSNLPFAPVEVAAISLLFHEASHVEGAEATPAAVREGIAGHAYIHFACHAFVDRHHALASRIQLAEGSLTLADVHDRQLSLVGVRLVTLSACETGMGCTGGALDEYQAIAAGFLLAGVPCVVSSLWVVPDLPTAMLMDEFYSSHVRDGLRVATALAQAQHAVRARRAGEVVRWIEQHLDDGWVRDRSAMDAVAESFRKQETEACPFAHPYYWAGFTVHGG